MIEGMATYHISEADAAGDFAGLLDRVRKGAEVVIDKEASPAVVLRSFAEHPMRRLSESLRIAKERGSMATLDGGYAADLEAVVNSHREPLSNPWARFSIPASSSLLRAVVILSPG
jgi:prevent-host-death family protein